MRLTENLLHYAGIFLFMFVVWPAFDPLYRDRVRYTYFRRRVRVVEVRDARGRRRLVPAPDRPEDGGDG